MSDIQLYLLEVDRNKAEASRIAQGAAQRIKEQKLKLLELIESVGEYVNSEDTAIRARSLSFLSEVFEAFPQKTLSRQQRELLCEFITSRIADDRSTGIGSCAKALAALEALGKWDENRLVNVISTFLNNTHPLRDVGVQSERYAVLRLIDTLFTKYREGLRRMHNSDLDFMTRFISYFDGEKDPRNLMVIFSILKVPMTEWEISSNAQDLFDAVFNYFPITFKPPPDDPYGITALDLKVRLRDCIASTSAFAPYSFPALLDKLDSTSMNTKRDVLQTINACAVEYGAQTVHLYASTLWDALKFEVLNAQDEDLASDALDSIGEIALQLSKGSSAQLNSFLKPIAKECNEHLQDAPTKQSQASGRILSGIIRVSEESANFLLSAGFPHILVLLQAGDNIIRKKGLLEVLAKLIQADGDIFGHWRSADKIGQSNSLTSSHENVLTKFSNQILDYLTGNLEAAPTSEVSLRNFIVDGLVQLVKVQEVLSDNDIRRIIRLMINIIFEEESYGRDEVKSAAINALLEIARQKPQLAIEEAIPAFMARLPDLDSHGHVNYMPALEALARLGRERDVFSTVVIRLLNKLNVAIQVQSTPEYLVAILSSMLYVFANETSEIGKDAVSLYYEKIVRPLLLKCHNEVNIEGSPFNNKSLLDLVGRLCSAIIRPRFSHHTHISQCIYNFEWTKDSSADQLLFLKAASPKHQNLLVISTHLLSAISRDKQLVPSPWIVIPALIATHKQADQPQIIRAACLRQLSLYVNKFTVSGDVRSLVQPHLYDPEGQSSTGPFDDIIRASFAIGKGLMLRNHPFTASILSNLLSALDSPSHGLVVARGFAALLQPDDLLTRVNYCVVSGLHVQKTFVTLVPPLTTAFRNAPRAARTNYLIALSGILRWVPYDIVGKDLLPSLTPLLLQSLDLHKEDEVRLATLSTITTILAHDANTFVEHANSLISRLLNTAKATMSVETLRAEALKCLAIIPSSIKVEVVMPLRRSLVKNLVPCLDDGRRSVRAEAVRCRVKWLDLGEDDDEDD